MIAKLNLILDTITDGVLVVDSRGIVLYANESAEILLARGPLIGQLLAIPVDPDKNSVQDINLIRPNGIAWAEMRSTPLEWDGQPAYVIALRDITASKQAEASLLAADQRKDEFLAMLAHELRNPLAPISNAANILDMLKVDDPRLNWAKELIKRQVSHLTHLVDELLDISRIARGKILLKKEPLDLVELIEQVVETARDRIQAKRQDLNVYLPEQSILIEGDLVRMSQVLLNLLDNASKYSVEGCRIEVDVTPIGAEVVIQVRDNGIGISGLLLPTIFDLFQQGERTLDRSQGGLGIGLTLVKRIVELHGGRVTAASPGAGLGSIFTIQLPTIAQSAPFTPSEEPTVAPEAGIRVLVVDDDSDVRESTGLLLEMNGYEVMTGASGEHAIALIGTFHPDVVLLDIGMPEENGYQVAQRIRQLPNGNNLLLITLSGYGQAQDKARSLKAGFDHHLIKPLNFNVFCNLISEWRNIRMSSLEITPAS
ncbi:MAG: hybrid sensor histidine kinase/response regulator [Methylomonas sp.]